MQHHPHHGHHRHQHDNYNQQHGNQNGGGDQNGKPSTPPAGVALDPEALGIAMMAYITRTLNDPDGATAYVSHASPAFASPLVARKADGATKYPFGYPIMWSCHPTDYDSQDNWREQWVISCYDAWGCDRQDVLWKDPDSLMPTVADKD